MLGCIWANLIDLIILYFSIESDHLEHNKATALCELMLLLEISFHQKDCLVIYGHTDHSGTGPTEQVFLQPKEMGAAHLHNIEMQY